MVVTGLCLTGVFSGVIPYACQLSPVSKSWRPPHPPHSVSHAVRRACAWASGSEVRRRPSPVLGPQPAVCARSECRLGRAVTARGGRRELARPADCTRLQQVSHDGLVGFSLSLTTSWL